MDWKTPYVIYRLNSEGHTQIVSIPEDITKAKYWLQYIAEPLDVLCKTPLHPKHSKKSETPEYWAHKEKSGKPAYTEEAWRVEWERLGWNKNWAMEE